MRMTHRTGIKGSRSTRQGAGRAGRLRPLDARADDSLVQTFAVLILDLNLLGRRIHELEVIPKRSFLLAVLGQIAPADWGATLDKLGD